jgi:tryptophanyl-tRNA synthetase
MRAQYEELMAHPARIEQTLLAGAERARAVATPFLRELRAAVGLRSLVQSTAAKAPKSAKAALPSFKQYRETDGKFYFKLVDADGRLLLQSTGFDSPRDAGQAIGRLQQQGASALQALAAQLALVDGVQAAEVTAALQALAEAAAAR